MKKLEKLELLVPSAGEPKIGTMHRLVQDVIRQRHHNNRHYAEQLIECAYSRGDFLSVYIECGGTSAF